MSPGQPTRACCHHKRDKGRLRLLAPFCSRARARRWQQILPRLRLCFRRWILWLSPVTTQFRRRHRLGATIVEGEDCYNGRQGLSQAQKKRLLASVATALARQVAGIAGIASFCGEEVTNGISHRLRSFFTSHHSMGAALPSSSL